MGRRESPDTYAGAVLAADGSVELFFTQRNPSIRGRLVTLAAREGVEVRFRSAEHPLTELEALRRRISNDMAALRELGVVLVSVGDRIQDNRVGIAISSDVRLAERILSERYDAAMLGISEGRRATLT
jgi:hypothetical protein